MVIKRVEPVSAAKISGVLYALMGLLLALLFAAIGSMAGGLAQSALPFAGVGVAAIIILPIIYGCIGFIATLIMAALYNVVAGWVGGVEIQAE
jgi:hypothetical protein